MPEIDFIDQLRYQLVKLGCPAKQVRRLVQEIAEHREDLKQAAVSEGLAEEAAESRANTRLGDPFDLAKDLMVTVRRSSWWGRHFFIGFCVLPLLAVPVLWLLLLSLGLSLEFALGYGWNYMKLHVAANNPIAFHHMVIAFNCADYASISLVTLLFCWLARRSAVSLAWLVTACVICSIYALFIQTHIRPHNFILDIAWRPQWFRSAIPLLIAGVIYIVRRRAIGNSRKIRQFSFRPLRALCVLF
jgi:hypothetical protein